MVALVCGRLMVHMVQNRVVVAADVHVVIVVDVEVFVGVRVAVAMLLVSTTVTVTASVIREGLITTLTKNQ